MTEAAPRHLLRDRDRSYGAAFQHRVRAMGITEVITAPRSALAARRLVVGAARDGRGGCCRCPDCANWIL